MGNSHLKQRNITKRMDHAKQGDSGTLCCALHNENKAEAFFNRAIYLNPEHVEALNHMAFIRLQRGNNNSAERLRQRAQRIVGARCIVPLSGGREK